MRAWVYRSSALVTEPAGATAPLSVAASVPAFVPSLGYLRALIVVLVVVFHSVLAYVSYAPPVSLDFAGGERLWRAFPIVDPQRWALAAPIVIFNDTFFMSLMFLLSGLFVSQSVQRKGLGAFLRDRLVRLGVPFLFMALLVSPVSLLLLMAAVGRSAGPRPLCGSLASAWATGRPDRRGSF